MEEGDARSLPLAGGSVDSVLLLGPLYHLGERAERIRALHESRRVCRAGGIVLAAAISRYAPLLGTFRGRLLEDEEVMANIGDEVATGRRVPGSRLRGRFPDAYFHLPDELREESPTPVSSPMRSAASKGLHGCSTTRRSLAISGSPGCVTRCSPRRGGANESWPRRARLLAVARA